MNDPFPAFAAVKKAYRGKTLANWLAKWTNMPLKDLEKANSQFLTTMTTWVVRKFQSRRKGGVPMGNLAKFALPETQKINFTDALIAMVVMTLRNRGLVEADTQLTDHFRRLCDAFDRAPKIQP